jgi:hypothetical protein
VPPTSVLLSDLASTAGTWRPLAIAWHVAAAILMLAVLAGWRPSARRLAGLLVLPIASVSAVAWASGKPFNGATFAVLTIALVIALRGVWPRSVHFADRVPLVAGVVLTAFGWLYPHFVEGPSFSYAYAAPLGVLPCPTLSAVAGVTLVCGLFSSVRWALTIALGAVCYGAFGAVRLGVTVDLVLLAGGIELGIAAGRLAQRLALVPRHKTLA